MAKVDVVTVEEVKIKKWCWWSNWIDIALFNYSSQPFLIQMSVSRTNGKRFRSICITGKFYKQCSCAEVGNLTQMKEGGVK